VRRLGRVASAGPSANMSSITPAVSDDSAKAADRLRGSLGVAPIVLMVVATAAPLTVMVANTPLIISMGNGAAAPFDAFVATIIMFLFASGFVGMSPFISNAGAFYAYIQKGLGRTIGLGSATLALASYFLILLALEAYIGVATRELLLTVFGGSAPWWCLSLVAIGVIGFLGYQHIEVSSKFLAVALLLEISVVVVANVVIVVRHGGELSSPVPWRGSTIASGSPGLGVLFAIYCFIGFESTVIFREEARDPERTIPRATFLGLFIIGIFYVVSMWCEVVGVGPTEIRAFADAHPADMYQMLIARYLGNVTVYVVRVLLITSLFACCLSLHNVLVRYKYVLGCYGVLHVGLARVHPRHHSPYVSSLTQTLCSTACLILLVFIGLDPVRQIYAWGATAGTLGYMVILALTCVSVLAFFASRREPGALFQTKLAPAGGLAGLLVCLWIAVENLPALVGGDNAHVAAVCIALGVAICFLIGVGGARMLKLRSRSRYERLKELA
jgi:amino acid transporter